MTFLGVPCLASSRIAPCLSRPIISLSRGMFCWRVSATSMKLSMAPSLAQDQGGKIRIPQRGIFTVLLTVLDPLHQEADAADRVERLKQKRLEQFLRRDRRTPGVGVHRRKLGGKVGKSLFDHGADLPEGMILRNEGLRGAVTEHPVGSEIRSAHKSISLILKGFYAGFYHGNRIYVT